MKILALDTTGKTATVALVCETHTIAEFTTNYKKNHSEVLMPLISSLLETVETSLSDVDYIAVSSGPGSFTGLRIGAATAKALAHGAGKKIISVPTLLALAYNVYDTQKIIIPIMDARRNQVYTAFFKYQNNKLLNITEYMTKSIDEILTLAQRVSNEHKAGVVFIGDATLLFKEQILKEGFLVANPNFNMQRASSVGMAAFLIAFADESMGYNEFTPFYLRASQAEREFQK